VKALKPDETIVLTPAEKPTPLLETFASLNEKERVVVIIGGFSKGDFRSDLSKIKHTKVSMGPRLQKVWTVAYKVFSAIQYAGRAPDVKVKEAEETPEVKDSKKAPEAKVKATKPSKPRRAPKKKEE